MKEKIATDIDTALFFAIPKFLKEQGWQLTAEYKDLFDKGIDFDFYRFEKGQEQVLMEWDNWFEGSIRAKSEVLDLLSETFEFELKYNTGFRLLENTDEFLKSGLFDFGEDCSLN